MTDMREKERLLERPKTRPPEVVPPKAKPFKPAPPKLFRWIEWMAVVVAAAALIVGAIWLAGRGGDEEVIAFHAEHGPFTDMAARDLSAVDLDSRLAGLDANLDRDVIAFPEFTAFPDSYARNELRVQRFAGLDANLDPDVELVRAAGANVGWYYDPDLARRVTVNVNVAPELGGYYDPYTSTWVPKQWFADEAVEFGGYYDPYTSQWVPVPAAEVSTTVSTSAATSITATSAAAEGYWNSYTNEWVLFDRAVAFTQPAPAAGYWNSYTNEWVPFEAAASAEGYWNSYTSEWVPFDNPAMHGGSEGGGG